MAKSGVKEAQNDLATLLYWGLNGIERNIQAGIELFNIGARNNNPQSMFNYAVALMMVRTIFSK